jgi:hypothetical protein
VTSDAKLLVYTAFSQTVVYPSINLVRDSTSYRAETVKRQPMLLREYSQKAFSVFLHRNCGNMLDNMEPKTESHIANCVPVHPTSALSPTSSQMHTTPDLHTISPLLHPNPRARGCATDLLCTTACGRRRRLVETVQSTLLDRCFKTVPTHAIGRRSGQYKRFHLSEGSLRRGVCAGLCCKIGEVSESITVVCWADVDHARARQPLTASVRYVK